MNPHRYLDLQHRPLPPVLRLEVQPGALQEGGGVDHPVGGVLQHAGDVRPHLCACVCEEKEASSGAGRHVCASLFVPCSTAKRETLTCSDVKPPSSPRACPVPTSKHSASTTACSSGCNFPSSPSPSPAANCVVSSKIESEPWPVATGLHTPSPSPSSPCPRADSVNRTICGSAFSWYLVRRPRRAVSVSPNPAAARACSKAARPESPSCLCIGCPCGAVPCHAMPCHVRQGRGAWFCMHKDTSTDLEVVLREPPLEPQLRGAVVKRGLFLVLLGAAVHLLLLFP